MTHLLSSEVPLGKKKEFLEPLSNYQVLWATQVQLPFESLLLEGPQTRSKAESNPCVSFPVLSLFSGQRCSNGKNTNFWHQKRVHVLALPSELNDFQQVRLTQCFWAPIICRMEILPRPAHTYLRERWSTNVVMHVEFFVKSKTSPIPVRSQPNPNHTTTDTQQAFTRGWARPSTQTLC